MYTRVMFATQKRTLMRTIAAAYSDFSRMIVDDLIFEDDTVNFTDICASLRICPADLNEILQDELGMNGDEILQSFQKLLTL